MSIELVQDSNDILRSRIQEVLHIIHREYQDDISLDYLAQRVYISPCYLSTLFSKIVGTSLLAYINDYRMHQAVTILTQTDTTVTDICYLVGYRNLPYFCTSFKAKYHMTPAQYRRSCVELAEDS